MTIDQPLVSVIIPVHNGEQFVSRTIASALAQTYGAIEVVVVDDGSTDQTAAVVEAAAARDDRVRPIRAPNSGVAAARNLAISKARGQLIAPLDADDLWHPEKIARQVRVMQGSPSEVGVIYCRSIDIDENDFIIKLPRRRRSEAWPRGRVTEELAKNNFLGNGSSPLIKRSYLDAVGGYDTSLLPSGAEDWKLYLALSGVCEFEFVPDYLVGYRRSPESMSRNIVPTARSIELVTRWVFEKWPNLPNAVRRKNAHYTNLYLAQIALDNNQFWAALSYRAAAYRSSPAAVFGRSSLKFAAHFLARMAQFAWFGRIVRRPGKVPVPFATFELTLSNALPSLEPRNEALE
jgi:glycosyltransferase involved in cell wall biosynthesis